MNPRGERVRRQRAGLEQNFPGERRWGMSRRWRRFIAVSAALLAVAGGLLGGLVGYAALTVPDVNQIGKTTGTIKILDRNGSPIAEVGHNSQNRTSVTLDHIAQTMQDATLAAEDRNFYNEGAINVGAVLRALVRDVILRRPAEGASTITQQLAKQAFFGATAEKSPLRKLREAILASQIDGRFTKQQILEKYLNIVYYGENAYGVEDASQRYFGKHASDLTMPEAALLAGLPQAPSRYDPFLNPSYAFQRMHYVLGGLVATGKISRAEADAVDPEVGSDNDAVALAARQQHQTAMTADLSKGHQPQLSAAPHFVQYVQDQLNSQFSQDPGFLSGDLTVTTTLDLNMQRQADTAVANGVRQLQSRLANNGALLMLDANTGDIKAMVGSANYGDPSIAGQYDIVTADRRPGSSFKPYVYAEGFRNGTLRPDTIMDDTRAESQKLGGVQDFDRSYMGRITAAKALLLSRNIPAEQAMVTAGVTDVINFASSLGITTPIAENASSAIGTSALRMIDHTAAYAAFANGGHKVTARSIVKVVDGNQNVLFQQDQPPAGDQVMTPEQAYSVTNILRGYASQWHLPFHYPTAGKSGTTDNFVDAWYMTYTPDWVVATWTGHTDGKNPAEVGMNQVFGVDAGNALAVPFVNTLPRPRDFTSVSGALQDCITNPRAQGCATPTPSPTETPTPTPTETPSEVPTPSATPCVTPPVVIHTPSSLPPTPTATPCP